MTVNPDENDNPERSCRACASGTKTGWAAGLPGTAGAAPDSGLADVDVPG